MPWFGIHLIYATSARPHWLSLTRTVPFTDVHMMPRYRLLGSDHAHRFSPSDARGIRLVRRTRAPVLLHAESARESVIVARFLLPVCAGFEQFEQNSVRCFEHEILATVTVLDRLA